MLYIWQKYADRICLVIFFPLMIHHKIRHRINCKDVIYTGILGYKHGSRGATEKAP